MNPFYKGLGKYFSADHSRQAFQFFSLFRYATLLLISIGLARIFVDQDLIADYERMLLVGGSMTFFWVGSLNDAYLVMARRSKDDHHILYANVVHKANFMLSLLAGLGTVLLIVLLYPDRISWKLAVAFGIFLAGDSFSMHLVYHWLNLRQGKKLLLYTLIIYTIHATAFLIPVYLTRELLPGLTGLAATGILKLGLSAYFIPGQIKQPIPRSPDGIQPSRELWQLAFPLALAALLSHSATFLDSYLVEYYFPEAFTNFRYGAKELPLVLLLANAFSVSMSGEIASGLRATDEKKVLHELKRGSTRLQHLLFPVSLLLLCISRPLFVSVFGMDFAGAVPVFDIYLLLVLPRLLFPQSILRGHGMNRYLTLSAAIELVLNIILSLIGLYFWGAVGIAMATVIAFSVEKIVLVFVVRQKLGYSLLQYAAMKWWMLYSAILVGTLCLKYLYVQ